MFSEIIKYISVYLLSMVKFMAGPPLGVAVGISTLETILISIFGMMTSVVIFSLIGERIKFPWLPKFIREARHEKPTDKRFIYLWKKFGVFGVTFLTPVLFTPIGGTILVTAMGSPKGKIIIYMLFSAVFWSIALSKIAEVIV
ncbi:MAG: hypothetical protein OER04_06805 [Cyclobacteriaceae bacterium]|nr:hypothetical protein [Cyclobacteriaceae bacterium]